MIGTDYNDINNLAEFHVANTSKYPGMARATDGSIQAIQAGIDQDLGGTAFTSLGDAVAKGLVNETYIDRAAANVLRQKVSSMDGMDRVAWDGLLVC
jgi:hypothetical protein